LTSFLLITNRGVLTCAERFWSFSENFDAQKLVNFRHYKRTRLTGRGKNSKRKKKKERKNYTSTEERKKKRTKERKKERRKDKKTITEDLFSKLVKDKEQGPRMTKSERKNLEKNKSKTIEKNQLLKAPDT